MIYRAIRYISRKASRTLILLTTLWIIFTFILTGLAILTAADQATLRLRQTLGGSIRLELDESNPDNWSREPTAGGVLVEYTGPKLTDSELKQIASLPGIRAWNGVGDGSVYAVDFSFIPGVRFAPGADDSRLPAVTDSSLFDYFRRGAFRLVDGRHLTPADDHAVLISTELAARNNLETGDTITVRCSYDAGPYPEVALEIVGIYESTLGTSGFETTSTDKRNRLIIDHRAMREIMGWPETQYDSGIEFFVDDPASLESIAAEIRSLDFDWSSFKLTVDDAAYEAAASPLTTMQYLTAGLVAGTALVSTGVLALILSIWTRQRDRETGILLSFGIGKARIIGQHLLETLLIALCAFGFACATSSVIAQHVSNLLFAQVAATSPPADPEVPDDGTEYLDIAGRFLPYSAAEQATADSIIVQITAEQLFWVGLLCAALCAAAVLLSSLRVLKAGPKNLLTHRN